MVLFILMATFATVGLLAYGIMAYLESRRQIQERFKKPKTDPLPVLRRQEKKSRFKNRFIEWTSIFGKYAVKDKEDQTEISDLKNALIQAGFRHAGAPTAFFGLRVILAILFPLGFMAVLLFKGRPNTINLMTAFTLAGAGYYGPKYILNFLANRRQDRIDRALPDVLDLMIVSMEAGLSLQATLNKVSDEVKPLSKDLHREMQVTNAELRTGIPRDIALKNLGERTGVQSVKSLVALMIQSEKMGASISQSLRNHATFTRVQRAQRAEEMAAKMPIKIVFPTLFCIFPAIFIVVLGPAAMSIYRNFLNR